VSSTSLANNDAALSRGQVRDDKSRKLMVNYALLWREISTERLVRVFLRVEALDELYSLARTEPSKLFGMCAWEWKESRRPLL
jgi:hypothetical protein